MVDRPEEARLEPADAAILAPATSVTGTSSTRDSGVPEGVHDSACCKSEASSKRP